MPQPQPAGVPAPTAAPARPWAALEIYSVIVLIGGAFAVPVGLPLLGGVLVQFSRRWSAAARAGTLLAVVAPLALWPLSVQAAVLGQVVASSVAGVLLGRALRR